MAEKIWLASPHMSDEGYEQQYVQEAFDTNWVAPLGPNANGFENELATKVGSKAASATTTGTAAIHLALKSVGITKGDIVFCQSLTFSATANPIIYKDAIPVFIDSDYETWNMCPKALEEGKVFFTGPLDEEKICQRYLRSHVFVCPSSIENSPNSLGEAMILGVPCIASYVGGIPDMLKDREEGLLYQHNAPYMLAHHICEIFEDKMLACRL